MTRRDPRMPHHPVVCRIEAGPLPRTTAVPRVPPLLPRRRSGWMRSGLRPARAHRRPARRPPGVRGV